MKFRILILPLGIYAIFQDEKRERRDNALWDKTRSTWDILSFTIPRAWEWAKEQTNEHSGAREQSVQCGASSVEQANEWANEQMDERVAQYWVRPDSWWSRTSVTWCEHEKKSSETEERISRTRRPGEISALVKNHKRKSRETKETKSVFGTITFLRLSFWWNVDAP